MKLKLAIQFAIIGLIIGITTHIAFFGPKGYKKLHILLTEIEQEEDKNTLLKNEIDILKNKITAAINEPFTYEKIAREDLQMSCTNEYIYLLKYQKYNKNQTL